MYSSDLKLIYVFRWDETFKKVWESVEDEPRAGHLSTSGIEDDKGHVRDLVKTDRRLNVRTIVGILGHHNMPVRQIIGGELGMRPQAHPEYVDG